MSEREIFHDSHDREGESDGEEVVFREDTPRLENSTPPTHNIVTANDLDVVIEGWGEGISTPLRGYPRDSIGLREGQYQHEQHREETAARARELRSAAYRKCTKDSHNSSRDATPRILQHHAASTHR